MEEPALHIPEHNGNHSDAVRHLFANNPATIFTPKKIKELFSDVPDTYVAPLLKRLTERGEIDRVGYGQYRSPRRGRPTESGSIDIKWVRPDAAGRLLVLATGTDRIYVAVPLEDHTAA